VTELSFGVPNRHKAEELSTMTKPRIAFAVIVLLLGASPVLAQEKESSGAGRVKVASGAAFVVREGRAIAATPGQVVLEADVLRTGTDGRLGVTLNDDTRVSLGPTSEIRVDRFSYGSTDGSMALALKFVRGVAAYVSGRIAKLSPDSVRLETPAAIVGVRGTTLAIRVDEQ
jgi:hypothetical protein